MAKPYQSVPIQDCGEPLMAIPQDKFALVKPHPYAALGAPYGDRSPYYLRQGVLAALVQAQEHLQAQQPGWRFEIFDAYRPVAVQQFMVDHTYGQLRQENPTATKETLLDQVYQFWAPPSPNPATPPPHSTGAAVDLTLQDAQGTTVDMGSPIDEVSERSFPNHFADKPGPYHRHRQLLHSAMAAAGFRQHPNEWWHFSLGDQLWAWLGREETETAARYGGI